MITHTDVPAVAKKLPLPIHTDATNSFAHHSMAVRVPRIIQDTIARNRTYSSTILNELSQLHDAIVGDAPLRLFTPPAPDYDLWAPRFESKQGETWLHTEWLFAEMLAYRLMVQSCQYWSTLRDPFAPFKQEELESTALWNTLSKALDKFGNKEDRLARCLQFSLWGNRMDLSLKQAASLGTQADEEHLLTNDIPAVVEYLMSNPPGAIHIIMDNAGTEQALDLVLVDHLLSEKITERIILHVKMQPVLVSDAIVADVHTLLTQMTKNSTITNLLAIRLKSYLNKGLISIVPDFFWNTAGRLWELPRRIYTPFKDARLVISKGDLNYRRATNDAIWPADATLTDALIDFPAPILALRTLKSDTLVGVSEEKQNHLDAGSDPDWRTSGAYGVAQFIST
ncbi:MAG: protein-glutamate O-methyltransferase family protein [Rhodothermaceae bacterium]|nr:protein-glutamate O-methyltransferase family protein [Rhodothermaceae bacterium]